MMFKNFLVLTLAALVLNLSLGSLAFAQNSKVDKAARRAEKVKGQIAKLGTGKDAKIALELINGSKIKGIVTKISEEGFVVRDQSGSEIPIQYSDTKRVMGRNLSTGVKIAIGFGIAAGALILLALIGLHFAD